MKPSDFQFKNPYLEELSFEENKDFDIKTSKVQIDNKFTVFTNKEKEENEALVSLLLEVNMGAEAAPFKLRIKMTAEFTWNKNIDSKLADSLLQQNAPALLLGYMRPIVAAVTNSSKYPVYNLPFMNFVENS